MQSNPAKMLKKPQRADQTFLSLQKYAIDNQITDVLSTCTKLKEVHEK